MPKSAALTPQPSSFWPSAWQQSASIYLQLLRWTLRALEPYLVGVGSGIIVKGLKKITGMQIQNILVVVVLYG